MNKMPREVNLGFKDSMYTLTQMLQHLCAIDSSESPLSAPPADLLAASMVGQFLFPLVVWIIDLPVSRNIRWTTNHIHFI